MRITGAQLKLRGIGSSRGLDLTWKFFGGAAALDVAGKCWGLRFQQWHVHSLSAAPKIPTQGPQRAPQAWGRWGKRGGASPGIRFELETAIMRWQSFPCHLLAPLSIFKINTNHNISKCLICTGISMESAHIWDSYPALLHTVQGTIRSINRISAAHFVLTQQLFFYLQNECSFPLIDCFGAAIWKIWNILSPTLPTSATRADLSLHLWSIFADLFFWVCSVLLIGKILVWMWCTGGQWPQARTEPSTE